MAGADGVLDEALEVLAMCPEVAPWRVERRLSLIIERMTYDNGASVCLAMSDSFVYVNVSRRIEML